MPRERLRVTLEELHRELQNADAIDGEARALLERTAAEITEALESTEPQEPRGSFLREGLENAARRFEVSHPTLFEVVRRTIDQLAQSGI